MENPKTKQEWQAAANAARELLLIDAARQYGLIEGGPIPDVDRCEEILRLAKERGIEPENR